MCQHGFPLRVEEAAQLSSPSFYSNLLFLRVHMFSYKNTVLLIAPETTLTLSVYLCVYVSMYVQLTWCYFVCMPARHPVPQTAARSSEEHTPPSASTTDCEMERKNTYFSVINTNFSVVQVIINIGHAE